MWNSDDVIMWWKYGEDVFNARRRLIFRFSHFEENDQGEIVPVYMEEMYTPATPAKRRKL